MGPLVCVWWGGGETGDDERVAVMGAGQEGQRQKVRLVEVFGCVTAV